MAQTLVAAQLKMPCPRCRLPLSGHESHCPACGKRIYFSEGLLAVVLVGVVGLVGLGILAAGQLRNVADRAAVRPQDAYDAAREFVIRQPGVKGPAVFAPIGETVLDQWGPSKYLVSGRAEAHDESGRAVSLIYSCVVERDQRSWSLHDIGVQLSR